MLRGVVPDSFPCQPTVLPVRAPGQRRFVVMDDNVHRIYGERVQKVCLLCRIVIPPYHHHLVVASDTRDPLVVAVL